MLADFNLLERIAEAFEDIKNQPYVTPLMLMFGFLQLSVISIRLSQCVNVSATVIITLHIGFLLFN